MLLFMQTCCHAAGGSRRTLLPFLSALSQSGVFLVDNASAVAKDQLTGSSGHHDLQQHRGLAAKKAKAKKDVKKGQTKSSKKSKQKIELKAVDDKDPFVQKLVAMLVPAQEPMQRTAEQQQEAVLAAQEYRKRHNQRHKAWSADMRIKMRLKLAALSALPPDLRQAAREEDMTPFPLTRHFLYDSPPDSYKQ